VTAPSEVRQRLGNCKECGGRITTHGYEWVGQYATVKEPTFEQKEYASTLLCEKCFHSLSRKMFWLTSIDQLGCLVQLVGLIVVIVGAVTSHGGVAAAGGAMIVLPALVKVPARHVKEGLAQGIAQKHFPSLSASDPPYFEPLFPWFDKSYLHCVPTALAVVVHEGNPVQGLSLQQVQAIVRGEITSWSELGGPAEPINLYLAVGPWRSWTLIKRTFLEDASPGPHHVEESELAARSKVTEDPNGLAFVSLMWVDLVPEGVKVLEIDGQQCAAMNAAYPLWVTRDLFPVAPPPPASTG